MLSHDTGASASGGEGGAAKAKTGGEPTATADRDPSQRIFTLQHIETEQYICLLQDGVDYLACFSDGDTAYDFRSALGLQEHVDIAATSFDQSPFTHFWLDGANYVLPEAAKVA